MAFCSECGKPFTAGAKFCAGCGRPVNTTSFVNPTVHASPRAAPSAADSFTGAGLDPSVRTSVSQTLFVVAQSMLADFQRMLNAHRLTPLGLASGSDTQALRQRAQSEVVRHQGRLRYVCILGDWELVPPYEMESALDGEATFSDSPYAGGATGQPSDPMNFIPLACVSRVPVRDMNVIERVLFQPLASRTASEAFAFSITAQKWLNASEAILQGSVMQGQMVPESHHADDEPQNRPAMLLSPDWDESSLADWVRKHPLPQGSLLHFNVHGGGDTPDWVGEGEWGGYEPIFSPGTIPDFASAVLFTEACFGGAMGYDDHSVVEHFFLNGGHAFVGCSVPAYGDPGVKIYGVPTFGADTLALAFFSRLQQGMKLGEAFAVAKMAVLTDDPPLCHPYSVKTVCSFNLYGAPWHAMKKEKSPAPASRREATTGSALDRIRSRMGTSRLEGLQDDDDSLLNTLRASYRERLRVPLLQRTVPSAEAASRLQVWLQNPEISDVLNRTSVQASNLRLHQVQHSDHAGFLIEGHAGTNREQEWILVLNDQGDLRQVIASKSGG